MNPKSIETQLMFGEVLLLKGWGKEGGGEGGGELMRPYWPFQYYNNTKHVWVFEIYAMHTETT